MSMSPQSTPSSSPTKSHGCFRRNFSASVLDFQALENSQRLYSNDDYSIDENLCKSFASTPIRPVAAGTLVQSPIEYLGIAMTSELDPESDESTESEDCAISDYTTDESEPESDHALVDASSDTAIEINLTNEFHKNPPVYIASYLDHLIRNKKYYSEKAYRPLSITVGGIVKSESAVALYCRSTSPVSESNDFIDYIKGQYLYSTESAKNQLPYIKNDIYVGALILLLRALRANRNELSLDYNTVHRLYAAALYTMMTLDRKCAYGLLAWQRYFGNPDDMRILSTNFMLLLNYDFHIRPREYTKMINRIMNVSFRRKNQTIGAPRVSKLLCLEDRHMEHSNGSLMEILEY